MVGGCVISSAGLQNKTKLQHLLSESFMAYSYLQVSSGT